jgi:drug/metabolite transporter (DMT)-like permease
MTRIWSGLNPTAQGVILMVLAIFLFSIMDTTAKELSARYHSLQVVWARYSSQTLLAFILLAPRLKTLLRTRYLGLQLIRSAFLFGATMLFFFSFARMQLAEATAIFEVAPLLITLLAYFVLKEKVGPRRWLGVLLGLAGALIIIRPGSAVFNPLAILPFLAAGCFAGYAISTRFLGRGESPWTSFLYTALIGTIAASLLVPGVWQMPSVADAGLMMALGAIGGLGHLLLIRALTLAEASALAPLTYIGLIFNTLFGMVLFGEFPGLYTYLGSLVIVGAGLYVWHREAANPTPK